MSEVKVNKISPRSGTDVTLGDSGDTFTIPSGATINNQGTAVNFGATGSASWVTTVKTSTFTAVAGEGYFINTTGGVVSVNLPAGTAGAVVAVKDYAGTFDTNACTLVPNGSDKIGGLAANATLSTEGIAVTLVFIDSTQGWLVTDSGLQNEAPGPTFIAASGGNAIVTCGNFKTHIFTGPGTFCVSAIGNPAGSNSVEYLVVAGGGSGGDTTNNWNGGGGAGGFRTRTSLPSASPLNAPANLPISVQGYGIVVGGGGASESATGSGTVSTFSTITSAGGGVAGGVAYSATAGGSGGGGGNGPSSHRAGGAGNTPPVSPPQGNPGGTFPSPGGPGGGGGAGAAASSACGAIGSFIPTSFVGPTSPSYGETGPAGRYFSGGGGGGKSGGSTGGTGGGGNGGTSGSSPAAEAGTINTGGGGGGGYIGGSPGNVSGAGGSGIVMIRYKFQ